MPVVICELNKGESMITEKGSMSWMSPGLTMSTNAGGSIGKAFGRVFSGESMFQNIYTSNVDNGMIAFASSFPGSIRAIEIQPGQSIIAQKSAFLAATEGVQLSVHLKKKLGAGFFGGEGFIMQKISGTGIVFLEIDGSAVEYELAAGEKLIIDTGNLAFMSETCTMDIERIKGVKNVLFGGEGLFNTTVTGPGKVTVQTMPISGFANAISAVLPSKK